MQYDYDQRLAIYLLIKILQVYIIVKVSVLLLISNKKKR